MTLRSSLKSLMQRSAAIPSMRERAATLRASVGRSRVEAAPLPAPGSAEAKAAFAAACREHSIRTNPADGWPGLERDGGQAWTRDALGKAMDTGEITPAEYARLYPLASERELLIETAGHDLNLGSLFALAYAEEYPVTLPSTPSLEQDAASALASEDPAGDALLLQLGRQFEIARAREIAACEACNAADREAEQHMPERPACLTLRASDAPLHVYPQIMMAAALEGIQLKSADIEWLRGRMPMVHEVLRPIRQGERSHVDHPGRKFDIVPHPEAQARAEEIVGAWDAWWTEKTRIQGKYLTEALDDAANDAGNVTTALGEQIAALPAHTAAGFRVKLRALESSNPRALLSDGDLPDSADLDQILSHSLWRDVHGEAVPAADPINWDAPPPGFMAYPEREPMSFINIRYGLRLELERLHGIALAEFQRRSAGLRDRTGEAEAQEREAKIRADLFLPPLTAAIDPESDEARALGALYQPKGADPVFAAIRVARQAEAAEQAFEGSAEEPYTPEQRAREAELSVKQVEAMGTVLSTVPTTHAGRLALVEFGEFRAQLYYGDDWQTAAQKDTFGEIAQALSAAIRAERVEVSAHPDADLIALAGEFWSAYCAHGRADAEVLAGRRTEAEWEPYDAAVRTMMDRLAEAEPKTVLGLALKCLAIGGAMAWELDTRDDPALHDRNERIAYQFSDAALYGTLLSMAPPAASPTAPAPAPPNLVALIDFASASLEDLQALHDIANTVSDVASAMAWTGRCHARGWSEQNAPGDHYNAAGKLMNWLGDALTDVESAANNEARRRQPSSPIDRETRLEMLALPVIQNGDPDETAAFARDLLAHAEAERAGR